MQIKQKGITDMSELPPKPDKPFHLLKTFQRQNIHSVWFDQEILDPYHKDGVDFPEQEESMRMYKAFIKRVYDQPDPK